MNAASDEPVPASSIQLVQPMANPVGSPNARRAYTDQAPAFGIITPSSHISMVPSSA